MTQASTEELKTIRRTMISWLFCYSQILMKWSKVTYH